MNGLPGQQICMLPASEDQHPGLDGCRVFLTNTEQASACWGVPAPTPELNWGNKDEYISVAAVAVQRVLQSGKEEASLTFAGDEDY